MLYHVSPTKGIKILEPKTSTHKKPYVYAIENKVTGVLFGVRQDDFDFIISTDEKGTPDVYECYPDAMFIKYSGRSCYVYEVEEDGFLRGMTSWEPELVCETAVPVVSETEIPDAYAFLLEEEQKGGIVLHRYEKDDEYRRMIAGHIVDRLIRFEIDLEHCLGWDDVRFRRYYRGIVEELVKIKDGHSLA